MAVPDPRVFMAVGQTIVGVHIPGALPNAVKSFKRLTAWASPRASYGSEHAGRCPTRLNELRNERGISVGFRRGRRINYCRIGVVTHPEGSRTNQCKLSLIDPRS
ncbi:hypothetical protein LF1_34750 [Rubripirellula obstinata]|uniref:Uncharacterized protein n=1 Tax=Rubripirellula obstinata TaxID=406547 RepID=A0A5B1CNK1_9BACT|nr:hypothetical protein LF1_34750 [Rubripirellula obstinata]